MQWSWFASFTQTLQRKVKPLMFMSWEWSSKLTLFQFFPRLQMKPTRPKMSVFKPAVQIQNTCCRTAMPSLIHSRPGHNSHCCREKTLLFHTMQSVLPLHRSEGNTEKRRQKLHHPEQFHSHHITLVWGLKGMQVWKEARCQLSSSC